MRDRRGQFAMARSGNPAGRLGGGGDHVNRAARLLLAGDAAGATRFCFGENTKEWRINAMRSTAERRLSMIEALARKPT